MSNQIIPFEFKGNDVRVVTIDGEPWFVLADLCKVLDISNPSNVAARLNEGMRQTHTLRQAEGIRGNPNVTIVSEPGMYEVVIRSDKLEAAAFRRWITGTVLPEIRKTGTFGTPATLEQRALGILGELSEIVEQQKAEIAVLAPKADYVDTFVTDEDLRILRNVAKSLGMSEQQLRADLIERKWIYHEKSTRWSEKEQKKVPHDRYSAYSDKTRYFTPVPTHDAPRFRGEVMHTLKVTPAGAVAIARLYGKHLALVEAVAS